MEKLHSAKKRKNSTYVTFSTTLSDGFQKRKNLFIYLFSVGPAMNLRYSVFTKVE